MSKKSWCEFCFPPKQSQPEPPVAQPVVQAPVPEPQMVEVRPESNEIEPEPTEQEESQLTSITTLSAAFGRVSKRNSR
jgi:hypothetical protein